MKSNKKKLSKLSPRERAMAGLLKINNTPVTAPVANGDTIHDIKSFTKAENEREAVEAARLQLEAERPVRESEAQLREASRELRAAQREILYTRPSRFLAENCASVGTIDGNTTSVEAIRAAIQEALSAFRLELENDEGVRLTESGVAKLQKFSALNLGIEWRDAASFRIAFDHLSSLGVFSDRDLDRTVPAVQPAVEPTVPEPTLDDIKGISSESETGRKQINNAILRSLRGEAVVWFDAMAASLEKNFNYTLDDKETSAICDWMRKNCTSFTQASEWDRARLGCIRANKLPAHLKYVGELVSEEIEAADLTRMSFSDKQSLKRRILSTARP